MAKSLVEMAAEIVKAQAGIGRMSPDEIGACLQKTFQALMEIQNKEQDVKPEETTVQEKNELEKLRRNPLASIQRNAVISLESGETFKVLTKRHLSKFSLTPKEYKKKWGIPLTQPLSAKSLTAMRKKMAKERGLGEILKKARQVRKRAK